jgi:hypothetical protein
MTARGLVNWKPKDRDVTPGTSTKETLSYSGGGKISVSVASIVNSLKVQRQVTGVREIAASQAADKHK